MTEPVILRDIFEELLKGLSVNESEDEHDEGKLIP